MLKSVMPFNNTWIILGDYLMEESNRNGFYELTVFYFN